MGHYPPKQREQLFCQQIAFSNPKIIILTSLIQDGEVIYTPSDVCLKTMLVSNKNYRLIKTFASNDSHSTYRYEMFTHF